MARRRSLLLFLLLAARSSESIRVLESEIKLGDDRADAVSGAKLRDGGRRVKVTDITLCIR